MEDRKEDLWIVSAQPASTDYATSDASSAQLTFKEHVNAKRLRLLVEEFTEQLVGVFDGLGDIGEEFCVDTIEVSAVMAADGKLAILGSSVGGKVEGAVKFNLRRRKDRKPREA